MTNGYLLDTDMCVFLLRRSHSKVNEKVLAVGEENCFLSEITITELRFGTTAICNGLTIVTNNTKHFGRLPSLEIENWTR